MRALWARVLALGVGSYDLVGFVSNPNSDLRATHLPYEIKFFDQANSLINSVHGDLSLWPQEGLPIFIPNINVGRRIPVRAYLELTGAPRWERSSSSQPLLTISDDNFTNVPTPILKARLTNNSLNPVEKIEMIATLSDAEHNVFAASSTFIKRLEPNGTTDFSFTWPTPFTALPAFTDFYPHVAIEPPL